MVRVYGNIRLEDDFTHPLGPEQHFNESVYFNFFDPEKQFGGFVRIGNRANEGYAEVTVVMFQPDGSALFNFKRPQISSNDGWSAGGLCVDVLEPGERLRTRYEGSVVYLRDPRVMSDPSSAFKENPHRHIVIDLVHEAVGPMYGHVAEPGSTENEFARAHYEQHMRVFGTVHLEGEPPLELRGHGLRDHSWGPRYWQSIADYRWLTANFGDDLGMVVSVVGDRKGGVFHRGEELVRITELELESEYEPGTNYHRALRATIKLEDGITHRVEGIVRGFIPLRNRRAGHLTHIGEGMTEYRLDGGRLGFGLSEYLDQLA